MTTGNTTLTGTGLESARELPNIYKLRVVYTGPGGIVRPETTFWDGTQPLQIGRRGAERPAGRWLLLDDERASREHARLERSGAAIEIHDLHSKNGSSVNGEAIPAGEARRLRDGDVVRLGDTFLIFRHEPAEVPDAAVPSYLGVSQGACRARAALAGAAGSPRPVLILGETGTGKEVAAQALHQLSGRRGRLIAVNCAAIPATLAEAQLFGVRRGAYTGASEQPGHFQEAGGGTLFLDEVGELPAEIQPKLLRALESREVTPVGGGRSVPCDVKVVAATNRDLQQAVQDKQFRADLYARLAGTVVTLPTLRERREDVLLLAQRFAAPDFRPTPRLVAALLEHAFPLNVRELRNLIQRLGETPGEEPIVRELAVGRPRGSAAATALSGEGSDAAPPWKTGDPAPSREEIIALLTRHRGNLHAIERSFGCSRRQFRRWAEEKHGLDIASFKRGPEGEG